MKIILKPEVMARLLSYAAATHLEYSGFGFCERQDGNIVVYDFVLLDVGTWGYTEIDPKRILPLLERPDRKNMKVWGHYHPIGNGIPGPHNWSSRDELTIQKEPLGATPEAVSWSVSIVLTPGGFVGRIDNYLKGITQHLEVEPATADFFAEVRGWTQSCAASSSPAPSTPKRRRKSRGSPNRDPERFPAPETRKNRLAPLANTTKKSRSGKGKKNMMQIPLRIIAWFAKSCASFAGNTIRRLRPSPTSAPTTASTGRASAAGTRNATSPGCGGSQL